MASLNQSLMNFQVYDNDPIGDEYFPASKRFQSLFYLLGLILAEISWTTLAFVSTNQGNISYVGIVIIVWVLAWSIVGLKMKYMWKTQFIFWIQACYHAFMLILAFVTKRHHFVLCGSSTGIIFFIILELICNRKVIPSKAFLYLYIWYAAIFYDDLRRLFQRSFQWYKMIILYIYFIFFGIIYLIIAAKWRNFTDFAKWQIVCVSYPLSIIFVLCFAGSFPQHTFHFNWNWLTIVNHFVFGCCCYFLIKNKRILPMIIKRKQVVEQAEDNRMRLYQVSNNFLSISQDFMYNPRQSMQGGVPVSQCCICMDKVSTFCYFDCLHLTICEECALELLSTNKRNCPFCRHPSNMLLKVERLDGVIFVANARFRFQYRE